VTAAIKPLPDFVKGITNANVGYGDKAGAFNVWPTATPTLSAEQGKTVSLFLRIRPAGAAGATLKLPASAPGAFKLRADANGTYWLEIAAEAASEPGTRAFPVTIESSDGNNITVKLTVRVPDENLVVSPRQVDLGEVAVSNAKIGLARSGRVNLRKLVGALRIKSLSGTLSFLRLEQQAVVEGSIYQIRIRVNQDDVPKAGAYSGTIRIETDDNQLIEIPIKLTIVDK
jgi:hypothetical protein